MTSATPLCVAGAIVALIGAVLLTHFGPDAPAVMMILAIRPGPAAADQAADLFDALRPIAIACAIVGLGLALAYGGLVWGGRRSVLRTEARMLIGTSSYVMILAAALLAWFASGINASLSVVALSDVQLKASELELAVSETAGPMRWAYVILAVAALLLAAGCFAGFRPHKAGEDEKPHAAAMALAAASGLAGPTVAAAMLFSARAVALAGLENPQLKPSQIILWLTRVSYGLGALSLGLLIAAGLAAIAMLPRSATRPD